MSLSERKHQMMQCIRCSACKWVTTPRISGWDFATGCPSMEYGEFHSYSGGGKTIMAAALEDGQIGYTDEMLEAVFTCSMCGSCQISCNLNYGGNVEPMENMRELRSRAVEDGQSDPAHMMLIDYLKREDNIFGKPKADRSKWAEGLDIKDALEEKTEVYLHVGCHFSYDEEQWPVIRAAAKILQAAGVDFGFAKKEEICCGGRAYEMGYQQELKNYSESLTGRLKDAGSKILLTCCSDCNGTFKQLYPQAADCNLDIEVLHITEYIERLIGKGKIKFTREVPLQVTFHDPCHLGRLGEPLKAWKGEIKMAEDPRMYVTDPVREVNFGNKGVYDSPRNILQAIPGVTLTEMPRIREWTYCCGSGGGAKEAFPDFALTTGRERLREAHSTGAQALVTACPWCERNFKDAAAESGDAMVVYDIMELVLQAMEKTG
ncbi:MAG: (Fe-S)-binding protein [Desulfuromonadaceae bacterium]|nr:(Fe-S)-binding protein [Desulfuromonadaceae bacterium]